jgi:serine protease AprX
MRFFTLSTGIKSICTAILLLLSAIENSGGQVSDYEYYYRVYFKDKGEDDPSNYLPEDLLSLKAINRREKNGITAPDFRDIPVNAAYLDQVSALGFKLHCTSKWMNTALYKTRSLEDINILLDLAFVSNVRIVKMPGVKSSFNHKLDFQVFNTDLPPFDRPLTMLNASALHYSGFDGKNILIAVLDAGFINADQISSLSQLYSRNGIKATYDFAKNDNYVYESSIHGTAVLSVLSGKLPGFIEGTASGADYLLLKTEDAESEFPCEEDFWAAGAEYADSIGADIISSSLGYSYFDNPALNYKYSDLDGNTSFVTKIADIAASKGILVVNSAGNERDKEWKRIICPADGDSVLAVGAVDGYNNISDFSSAGPSADGRIKPDNVAMGVSVPVQTSPASVGRSNGTSFSCPVLSGMAACLMQAVPKATAARIIDAIHSGADHFNTPDSLYGFGIPDLKASLTSLQDYYIKQPDQESIAGPNPSSGNIEITFRQAPGYLVVEIISISGRILTRKVFPDFAGRTLLITDLQNKPQGIYFIRLINKDGVSLHKIIKLSN